MILKLVNSCHSFQIVRVRVRLSIHCYEVKLFKELVEDLEMKEAQLSELMKNKFMIDEHMEMISTHRAKLV